MTREELSKLMDWIDAEWPSRLSGEALAKRNAHWWAELRSFTFSAVMEVLRDRALADYPPRTGEIRAALKLKPNQALLAPDVPTGRARVEVNRKARTFTAFGADGRVLASGGLDWVDPYAFLGLAWDLLRDEPTTRALDRVLYAFEFGGDAEAEAKAAMLEYTGLAE